MTEHKAAVVVFYTNEGTVMMHERVDVKDVWLFVGGSVKEGELPKDVAFQKVGNELGYSVPALQFLRAYHSSEVTPHGSVHVFVAQFPGFEHFTQTNQGDFRSKLRLVSVEEARKLKTIPVVYDILKDVEVFLKNK